MLEIFESDKKSPSFSRFNVVYNVRYTTCIVQGNMNEGRIRAVHILKVVRKAATFIYRIAK